MTLKFTPTGISEMLRSFLRIKFENDQPYDIKYCHKNSYHYVRRTESCTESCASNILSKLGLSWDSNAFDVGKGIQHMIHYTVCANTAM